MEKTLEKFGSILKILKKYIDILFKAMQEKDDNKWLTIEEYCGMLDCRKI